jgi:hypothetical protein
MNSQFSGADSPKFEGHSIADRVVGVGLDKGIIEQLESAQGCYSQCRLPASTNPANNRDERLLLAQSGHRRDLGAVAIRQSVQRCC